VKILVDRRTPPWKGEVELPFIPRKDDMIRFGDLEGHVLRRVQEVVLEVGNDVPEVWC
jgi:hypothetical protein